MNLKELQGLYWYWKAILNCNSFTVVNDIGTYDRFILQKHGLYIKYLCNYPDFFITTYR